MMVRLQKKLQPDYFFRAGKTKPQLVVVKAQADHSMFELQKIVKNQGFVQYKQLMISCEKT